MKRCRFRRTDKKHKENKKTHKVVEFGASAPLVYLAEACGVRLLFGSGSELLAAATLAWSLLATAAIMEARCVGGTAVTGVTIHWRQN